MRKTSSRWLFAPLLMLIFYGPGGVSCKTETKPVGHLLFGQEENGENLKWVTAASPTVIVGDKRRGFLVGTAKGEVAAVSDAEKNKLVMFSDKPIHDGAVTSVAWSRTKDQAASIGGNVAALWQIDEENKLIGQVKGPQKLTALVWAEDGREIFFGTEQGHVLRWRVGEKAAEPVNGYACAGALVEGKRMELPEEKRCPYGVYSPQNTGPALCTYPVTVLAAAGGNLVRGCREGTLGILSWASGERGFYLAGHLLSIDFLGGGAWLLAREDGRVVIYDQRRQKLVAQLLSESTKATAVGTTMQTPPRIVTAINDELIAIATAHQVDFWRRQALSRPVGEVRIKEPIWWMSMEKISEKHWHWSKLNRQGRLTHQNLQLVN